MVSLGLNISSLQVDKGKLEETRKQVRRVMEIPGEDLDSDEPLVEAVSVLVSILEADDEFMVDNEYIKTAYTILSDIAIYNCNHGVGPELEVKIE